MIFSRSGRIGVIGCRRMVDQAEIHRKVASGDVSERREGVEQLRSNFADLPDKDEAWEDLIRLAQSDRRWVVRFWHNIKYWLTWDKNCGVRWRASVALGSAFQHVPDKDAAWKDLIRLTGDEDHYVRWDASVALGSAFQHVPDKDATWKDLHRLTGDKNSNVRRGASVALGSAFQHIPVKDAAWKDLHRLKGDKNSNVRWGASVALGSAFQHVPDKNAAWKDLHRLKGDKDRYVRVSAIHSLGKASIFKATEAENEERFREEMKNALEFFEESSKEATYFSTPSRFCLPFYRSFYTILFGKAEAKYEVQSYLAEAKSASDCSKNKETLLEAVENLANALSEAQNVTDFDATKSDLKAYMQYCNRAADLIGDAAKDAPGAAGILRRGLPIIDERIKEIIREIQEKAEAVCRETRGTGTPYEPLGIEVNNWARELSDRDYLQNERIASIISDNLGEFCNILPEGERKYLCKIVEDLRNESEPNNKLIYIGMALSYLLPSIKSEIQNVAKPMTDKTRSDEQPLQKTGHSTTVFAGAGSTVVVPHTETESGDVTVTTAVTKESQPDTQPDRSSKRTAIKISADIAVHVLVYTGLHYFAEDLMPVIAPILVLSALIILLLIIHNAKSG